MDRARLSEDSGRQAGGFLRLSLGASEPAHPEGSGEAGLSHATYIDGVQNDGTVGAAETGVMDAPTTVAAQREDGPTVDPSANEILQKALRRVWKGTPPAWTFADGSATEKAREQSSALWPIPPATVADLLGPIDENANNVLASVREWVEMAEDLIALQLLRHLSQFLAQLWVMVGFVVIGSLSLLLAINSYPFPQQSHLEFFLSILIGVAAFAILRLIVGINRNETISRVGNTMAGFKLDGNLLSGVVG